MNNMKTILIIAGIVVVIALWYFLIYKNTAKTQIKVPNIIVKPYDPNIFHK